MDTSTTRQHSRSAHPRFFRKHSPLGVSCILLGFVLFSFLWLGCEDVPTKYTVTFNTNGGTAVTSQSVKKGDLVTKPADPTRKDYVFGGWYSDAGLTRVYDFKAAVNANITLYAKWTAVIVTYTVTFNTNGDTAVTSQSVKKGDLVTKPANPTRKDYVFEGWYSDAALTQVYDFTSKVTQDITLYAKWKQAYKVLFETNGGTAIATQSVAQADTVVRPADPTRKDYVFENWYSDEALTQVYNFAAKVTKAITLYAKWKQAYKVLFETNGGTLIATQSVAKADTITKPANPTKAGFTFEGWYSDAGLTQVYDFASKVMGVVTLYAKWNKKEGVTTYTVTFNSTGGTAIVPQTVAKDAVATRPVVAPTRENYVFDNWYSDAGLTQVYDFTSKVTQDTTLYAKWTPTYTVMFNTNGGTAVASQTVKKDDVATKPTAPTRDNFVFENWYSDSGLTQVYDFTSKVTQDTTLYAKWTPTYTVMFNTNGGTAVASQTVKKDDVATKPTAPTKKDYDFENWYSDAGLTQVYDFTSKVTQDTTLYAKWTPTYRVMFNTNGGTAIAPQTVKKDDVAIKPTAPTKKDYDFENWYSDAGLTQVYDFTSKVTQDTTLYAKWRLKAGVTTYTVTFNTDGGTAVASQTVKKGDRVSKPTDPTKENYVFGGWYLDEALTQVYDFTSTVTADITLHVKWRPFPTSFTISAAGGATQVAIGTALQLRITNVMPSGADTSVKWLVEGGAANGSINTTGLYAAPNTIPTPAQITIRATGVRDTTVTQTYSLTVVDNPKLKTIPDASFRTKLKAIVPNAFVGDRLDTTHRDVTGRERLSVQNASIANMEGIQYFTALRRLDCNGNQLTALDVSKNTGLTTLYCNDNQLTALDVSKNTGLTTLSCQVNQLTALDVSQNTTLTDLYCSVNRLTALDVSKNTALGKLFCNANKLTSLDISQNTGLRNFNCSGNQLTTLDVSKNPALDIFYCVSTSLTSLDVSKNPALTLLACENNKLTTLDVSKNPALKVLRCQNNNLASLDVSKNTALEQLLCWDNRLTVLDMRGVRRNPTLHINAGSNGKNPIDTLKVHDNLKQHAEIKAAKTTRGTNIRIQVYTAAAGSTAYTQSCANYDPNANSGNGQCSSTN